MENAMKIGQGSNTPWTSSITERASSPMKASGGEQGVNSGPQVSLSALSGQLHAMESNLTQGLGFDAAKVESIKEAIRAGEFRVNPSKVADKLIDSVRELVGK
jgi:negative regulator of flagellin synthesis FlgM